MPMVKKPCTSCGTKGYVWPDPNTKCQWCGGTGYVTEWVNDDTAGKGSGGCMIMIIAIVVMIAIGYWTI